MRLASPSRQTRLFAALLAALFPGVARAQQNPIVAATTAPPPVAAPGIGFTGVTPYGYPYGGYPPYGYPYQNNNPSVQSLSNPQGQSNLPGQVSLPSGLDGGGQSSGGQGGSGQGGGGQGGGGQGGSSGGDAAQGASYEVMQDPSSPLYKRYERNSPVDRQIRPRILAQVGRGKGIRRGFIEETERLRTAVEAAGAGRLDARYDFSRVMIGEHLVPPVIGEARNVEERGGDGVLYLTLGAFQIVRPARLVVSAPTWRDYLYIDVAEPQTAISALSPTGGEENSIYDQAYQDGLGKGIEEARQTFDDNLNRLDRDYAGMERYHELARQGAVSLPVVRNARRAVRVADGGRRAFVGEQVVQLRVSPRFKAARRGAYQ